jgi:hypothetical protein
VPRHGPEDPSLLDGPGWGSGLTLCAPTFETHDAWMTGTVSGGGDTPHGEGLSELSAGREGGCGAVLDWHRCIFFGLPPEYDEWPGSGCSMVRAPRTLTWDRRSIPLPLAALNIWIEKRCSSAQGEGEVTIAGIS